MNPFFRATDGLSRFLSRLADVTVVVLVLAMLFEVAARYLFNRPTIWAFDISYMATGALFILGAGETLRQDRHIRIDLVEQIIGRTRGLVLLERLIYLVVMVPLLAGLSWIAVRRFVHAVSTGEVDAVSPWAPYLWPFYLIIAVGLLALCFQTLAEGLRAHTTLGGKEDHL